VQCLFICYLSNLSNYHNYHHLTDSLNFVNLSYPFPVFETRRDVRARLGGSCSLSLILLHKYWSVFQFLACCKVLKNEHWQSNDSLALMNFHKGAPHIFFCFNHFLDYVLPIYGRRGVSTHFLSPPFIICMKSIYAQPQITTRWRTD